MRSFIITISLVSAVLAAPSTGIQYCAKSFQDDYDSPAQLASGTLVATSVGTTAGGGLAYNGTAYGNQGPISGITLVVPSSTGTIGLSTLVELVGIGQPSWFPLAPYVFFDQVSICGACIINDLAAGIPVATSCSIQFAGVSYATGETAVQELQFNAKTLPSPSPFACTQFPKNFQKLSSVSAQLVQASLPQDAVVVLLDNNMYTAYQEC